MIKGRGTRFIGMDTRNSRKQIQNISWGSVFVYIKHDVANGFIIQELYWLFQEVSYIEFLTLCCNCSRHWHLLVHVLENKMEFLLLGYQDREASSLPRYKLEKRPRGMCVIISTM